MARARLVQTAETDRGLELRLADGQAFRVEAITDHIIRVRRSADGEFPEPALVRYGFVRDDWPRVRWQQRHSDATITLTTGGLGVKIAKDPVRLTFVVGRQALLAETPEPYDGPPSGFGARFALRRDEAMFGLGDQARDRIQQRGTRADMWVVNVTRYTPIPMCFSTRGYGVFVNTTMRHTFDLGATSNQWFGFEGGQGCLDYYVIHGPTPAEILDRYTDITGKPTPPPIWSFGLWFVCRMQGDAREMMDDCLNFRREGIPCDIVGLEPGWMETFYDYTVDKKWHPDRFPIPSYAPKGPHNFLDAARRMGFKPSLWLCNDYDLSIEEERQLAQAASADRGGEAGFADDAVEHDEHLVQCKRFDTITKPDQAWFEHLKQFIDQGVELFKQDGALQVLEHPDRKWANGMDDVEMHNLYPLLYSKQMHLGFRHHTGRRATCFTPCGWAGLQRYTGTWAGDTGGGSKPLVSMLNLGLSGHSLTTCDMEVTQPAGIHFGFLQPWAQVCSWNYWRHPWLLGDELKPVFMDYVRLRYRLLPYLYATCVEAYRTGMPMLRAMPLVYPDDRRTHDLLAQYMLGPALLVTAFTDDLYLPEGTWIDYWTGEVMHGPRQMAYTPPADRGGALWVKAGSIIPMWPVMDYVGQRPVDRITLDVYPGAVGGFTLYEDDGVTYAFEQGEVAETHLTCHPIPHGVQVRVGRREGSYAGMPERPAFDVQVHVPARPTRVRRDGRPVRRGVNGWAYDDDAGVVTVPGPAGPKTALTFEVTWGRARRRPTPGR